MRKIFLSLVFLAVASVAGAQTVKNPSTAVIGVSPDHASVTRYELGFFLPGATDPVQLSDIGTGTPINGELSKPLPSYPIGVTYIAKVKAYVNQYASDWSPESNPFYRGPAAPSGVVIR
jgi:hypothetical protein